MITDIAGVLLGTALAAATPLDDFLDAMAQGGQFEGVVRVETASAPVFERAFGYADVEESRANTPDTRFHIASITKTFTATLVLRAAETGALSLDDRLVHWVPELDAASYGDVTLRHLLELLAREHGQELLRATFGVVVGFDPPHGLAEPVLLRQFGEVAVGHSFQRQPDPPIRSGSILCSFSTRRARHFLERRTSTATATAAVAPTATAAATAATAVDLVRSGSCCAFFAGALHDEYLRNRIVEGLEAAQETPWRVVPELDAPETCKRVALGHFDELAIERLKS